MYHRALGFLYRSSRPYQPAPLPRLRDVTRYRTYVNPRTANSASNGASYSPSVTKNVHDRHLAEQELAQILRSDFFHRQYRLTRRVREIARKPDRNIVFTNDRPWESFSQHLEDSEPSIDWARECMTAFNQHLSTLDPSTAVADIDRFEIGGQCIKWSMPNELRSHPKSCCVIKSQLHQRHDFQ